MKLLTAMLVAGLAAGLCAGGEDRAGEKGLKPEQARGGGSSTPGEIVAWTLFATETK